MRTPTRASAITTVMASVVLLAMSGCDKGKQQAGTAKQDERAKPAEPEAKVESEPGAAPEPAIPAPAKPEAPAPAGAGFAVGPALPIGDVLDGMLEVDVAKPLTNAGATVSVGSHAKLDGEDEMTFYLRARVEFEGADPSAGLNHERELEVVFAERLFPAVREIAKLPDGRWLVDAQLACASGEDSISTTTDHSVILVDPGKRSAAVIWTGADRTLSDGIGACVTDSSHSFAVAGEELVVSKTELVERDAEIAKELGWSEDDCKAKPKTTTEVGRVELAGE